MTDNKRNRIRTLSIAVVIAHTAFFAGCGPKEDEDFFSDEEFSDVQTVSEITPQERIEQYKQILDIDPGDYQVRNNLGVIYAQLRLFDEAIEQFEKVIETKPDYTTAFLNMGAAYGDMGNLDKAIESFEKAIEISPGYAKAYQNLGVAYYETEQFQQAIDNFEKYIALYQGEIDETIFYTMALSYKQLGNKDMAQQYLQKVIEINPNNELVKENLKDMDTFMMEMDNQ